MRFILFFLLLYLYICNSISAQIISNVRAFSEEGKILIVYDLFTIKNEKEFYITLSSSTDNGKTYSKIYDKVSGDVFKYIEVGNKKRIIYSPEKPLEGTVFKVEGRPTSTKISYPIFEHPSGKLELIRVSWDSSLNLELLFKFENNRLENDRVQFILANFLMLDNQDVVYRKIILEKGNLFSAEKEKSIVIRIMVPNVSEKAKVIQKLEFNLSEIVVRMNNITIVKDEE